MHVRLLPRPWQVLPRGADAEGDGAVVLESILHEIHVIASLEPAPEDHLAAPADAVGVVLPDDPAVADLADDGGIAVPLERGEDHAVGAGVLVLDLGHREAEAGHVEEPGVRRLVIRHEQLGAPGVVEDLDPVLGEVPLEPGPRDVQALVEPASVVDLPGRPLARGDAAGVADDELDGGLLRGGVGEALGVRKGGDEDEDERDNEEVRTMRSTSKWTFLVGWAPPTVRALMKTVGGAHPTRATAWPVPPPDAGRPPSASSGRRPASGRRGRACRSGTACGRPGGRGPRRRGCTG